MLIAITVSIGTFRSITNDLNADTKIMIEATKTPNNANSQGSIYQLFANETQSQSNNLTTRSHPGQTNLLDPKIALNPTEQSTNAEKGPALNQKFAALNAANVLNYAQLLQEQVAIARDNDQKGK